MLSDRARLPVLNDSVGHCPKEQTALLFICLDGQGRNCLLSPLFLGSYEVYQRVLSLNENTKLLLHRYDLLSTG